MPTPTTPTFLERLTALREAVNTDREYGRAMGALQEWRRAHVRDDHYADAEAVIVRFAHDRAWGHEYLNECVRGRTLTPGEAAQLRRDYL